MLGIRRTDFYLRGAYGPSNLGDDVLMMVCASIIKQHYPQRKLLISAEHVERAAKFLSGFEFVKLEEPVHANIAVLGGGGQFFSFSSGQVSSRRRVWKTVCNLNWKTVVKRVCVEALHGRGAAFSSNKLLGLSLGVGPFENGVEDYQYQRAKNYLRKMDYLTVRDSMSEKLCSQEFGVGAQCYTDLAFARKYWLRSATSAPQTIHSEKIGVVVRDWKSAGSTGHVIDQFIHSLLKTKAAEDLVFISLDQNNDHSIISRYADMEWLIWEPGAEAPEAFIKRISQSCAYLISMRAHGVLLPAAMGIPSMAVDIEPKLRNVQRMLPNGTRLIGRDELSRLDEILIEFSANLEHYKSALKADFSHQEEIAEKMIKDFTSWIRHHE